MKLEHLSNPQIPIKAVLKYIVRDRDNYKNKLDQLIPYAKSLEEKLKALQEDYDDLSRRYEENEVKKCDMSLLKQYKNENEAMKAELKAFRDDYRQSEWYKQIEEDRTRARRKSKELKETLNYVLVHHNLPPIEQFND